MSIVYGQNVELPLDETLINQMYDVPKVTRSITSQSDDDVTSVMQIKEIENKNQTIHQNWIITSSTRDSSAKRPQSEKSFSITAAKPELKKSSIHVIRLKKLRRRMKRVVNSKYFEGFIVFCILLNTLFMAIESHGMDPVLREVVNIANIVSNFDPFLS